MLFATREKGIPESGSTSDVPNLAGLAGWRLHCPRHVRASISGKAEGAEGQLPSDRIEFSDVVGGEPEPSAGNVLAQVRGR